MSGSVLVVDDDEVLAKHMRVCLERIGWNVRVCGSAEEALTVLNRKPPDVMLVDYLLPGRNGLDLIASARRIDRGIRVIMVTGKGNVRVAVDAMKAGACDYLTKPVTLPDLKRVVGKPAATRSTGPADTLPEKGDAAERGLFRLIGESPPMRAVKDTIRRIVAAERDMAPGDLPAVLITGETGTGKELAAQALHFEGARHSGPFVEVNCASIPATLLEAELFGHERGAFTDAKESKAGLVEAAEGGTLFLDEIGEVDPVVQAKLLKVLDEKTVRRLGSVDERPTNIRIVSATNRDLEGMVRDGQFRSDLYFRLHIIVLALPPLRARGNDVLLLAHHFLAAHCHRYGKRGLTLSPDAEQKLLRYPWPGNVRELRNALEQSVLLARGLLLTAEQIGVCLDLTQPLAHVPASTRTAADPAAAATPHSRHGFKIRDAESALILDVLERTDWNVSKAARLLGVTREQMRSRIERYGLERSAADQAGADVLKQPK